ncbi:MAG: UvrD-helicase domain-containing protein [Desulfuromonadaceae bacterium]|nr:UvrD-helicase domain-containing protein [Desulfuromonadaceae bacterium]
MSDLLAGLNPPQRQAVVHQGGPLLVLAGAGSGKTRTLTHRIAWLIRERQVDPYRILAVTFTNKAAKEMKERLQRLLKTDHQPWVSTFHATCVRILRREIGILGFTADFTIYDDADQQRLLKDCLKHLDIDEKSLKPRAAGAAIDGFKNEGLWPGDISVDDYYGRLIFRVYSHYQERLKQANALDFGDLILMVVKLFEDHPEIAERYRERFRHLLVDEFQDTNRIQYRLIQLLCTPRTELCVVGDDDQSIYSWRGAKIENILKFDSDFSGAEVIRLEQNYRSTKTILDASGEMIARNRGRKGKTLWTENPAGEAIRLRVLPDDLEEARFVAAEIGRLLQQGRSPREAAVFFRTNAQSRSLEEAMMRENIPYQVVGGIKFFARMEIKDILAYLRVLVNPSDTLSVLRVLNVPARGIGAVTIQRVSDLAERCGGFLPACREALTQGLLKGGAGRGMEGFLALIDKYSQLRDRLPFPQLTAELIEESGYGPMLREEKTAEGKDRLQNLQELLLGMEEHLAEQGTLSTYLEQVALVSDLDSLDDSQGRVSLMTFHSAKGLEFPFVFMTGMEEGLFPHSRATEANREIEEERRLCYVGMTRAMERLTLTRAERRRIYGDFQFNPASRFLREIPPHLLEERYHVPSHRSAESHNLAALLDPHPETAGSESPPASLPDEVEVVPEVEGGEPSLGSRVHHPKFGVGIVRRLEGHGDQRKVTVQFYGVGLKKLLLRFAGLTPA